MKVSPYWKEIMVMGRDKNCLTEICETIEDSADVANVVILAREFAADLGFSQTDQHLVATAGFGIDYQYVHYAGRGKLTIQEISSPKMSAFRLSVRIGGRESLI